LRASNIRYSGEGLQTEIETHKTGEVVTKSVNECQPLQHVEQVVMVKFARIRLNKLVKPVFTRLVRVCTPHDSNATTKKRGVGPYPPKLAKPPNTQIYFYPL